MSYMVYQILYMPIQCEFDFIHIESFNQGFRAHFAVTRRNTANGWCQCREMNFCNSTPTEPEMMEAIGKSKSQQEKLCAQMLDRWDKRDILEYNNPRTTNEKTTLTKHKVQRKVSINIDI